jgi:hypothetical protein
METQMMKTISRVAVVGILALAACAQSFAADSQPLLAKPGKLIFEDNFASGDMKPKWNVGKGFWSVKDGVASAAENPDDKHAAYAYMTPNVEYKDAIAEFSFKFDGAKSVQLNMRDSKYKGSHAGHIIRVSYQPDVVLLADWKTGVMKNENYEKTSDPKTDPAVKKEINASIKDKSARFKVTYDASQWHQARVEVAGDELLVSLDGKPVGYLKSEGIGHPTKNMLGITVGGKSAEVKDVKFWEATANPDWATGKSAVIEGLKK